MATDIRLLQGEIQSNPESRKIDLDRMLAEFVNALYREQFPEACSPKKSSPPICAIENPLTAAPIEALS